MADGAVSLQTLDHVFSERIGHQTHLAMGNQALTVGGDDTAGLLPAMLQRVQPEIDHVGRFGVAVDPHDRAFVVEFVRHRHQLRVYRRPVASSYCNLADSPVDQADLRSSTPTWTNG
jgi:hypothetical protein